MLAELKLEVALRDVQPWAFTTDFLLLNPAASLPVLEIEAGPVLSGAYPISEYLAEEAKLDATDSQLIQLFPGDHEQRAEVRRLVDWFHRKTYDEATAHILEEKLYKSFSANREKAPDADVMRAIRRNLGYSLSYLDHLVEERQWLAGDDLSFADFAAAGQLSCADYLAEVDWSRHERAKLWYAKIKSRPSMRSLLVERVSGAAPPPPYYGDPDF